MATDPRTGMPVKSRAFRRGKGTGAPSNAKAGDNPNATTNLAAPATDNSVKAHADAKGHMSKAASAGSPQDSRKHLFNALSAMKKGKC